MKKVIGAIVALLSLWGSSSAQQFSWQGTQLKSVLGGEHSFSSHLAIRTSWTHFEIPSKGKEFNFIYGGPKLNIDSTLWVAPQVGLLSGNWSETRKDLAIASLWFGKSFFKKQSIKKQSYFLFDLFLEGDLYWNHKQRDVYKFTSVDFI